MMKNRTLITGVGNIFRNDDGIGIFIAEKIKKQGIKGITVIEQSGEGTSLIDSWKNYKKVIIIDAVSSGSKPGTIHFFNAGKQKIPSDFFHYSTHAFSVAEAVELAKVLGHLPDEIYLYGIEGKDFTSGEEFSPEVKEAAGKVIKRITETIQKEEKDA